MRCVWLAMLTACGRIGFDATAGGGGDGGVADAARADALVDAGPPVFGPWAIPVAVTAVNSASQEYGPTISADGHELYFGSRRLGDANIYRATRPDRTSAFGAPTIMPAMMLTGPEEGEPSLSSDGLTMYFEHDPALLHVTTRPSAAGADWSVPLSLASSEPALVGYGGIDFGPGDLRLVVSMNEQLYEATRPSVADPWEAPQPLGIVGEYPCLRGDGLELMWEDETTPPQAIYRAERPALDQPFGVPTRLSFGAEFDSAGAGDPELTADGKILVFVAERPGMLYDVYITERERL